MDVGTQKHKWTSLLREGVVAGKSLVVFTLIIITSIATCTMMMSIGNSFWKGTKNPIAINIALAYSNPPTKQVHIKHHHQRFHHKSFRCYSRCNRQQQQFLTFHPSNEKNNNLYHPPTCFGETHRHHIHTRAFCCLHRHDDNTKATIPEICHGRQLQQHRQRPLLLCLGYSTTVATFISTNWRSSTTQRSAAVGTEDSSSSGSSGKTADDNSDNQGIQKQGHDNSAVYNGKNKSIIPRAAVSSCIRCSVVVNNSDSQSNSGMNENNRIDCCYHYYLLVQRGKQPNKGIWSFPGGKIEYGESTINGAMRELAEEVQIIMNGTPLLIQTGDSRLDQIDSNNWKGLLKWYKDPVTTSDSIGEGYHYLIAQCFGEMTIVLPSTNSIAKLESSSSNNGMKYTVPDDNSDCHHYHYKSYLPQLYASDDAMDASWFTKLEIQQMERKETATPGIVDVVQRIEQLSGSGLLPLLH